MSEKAGLTTTQSADASASHSNILTEFLGSAYSAGVERPLSGIEQLVGLGKSAPAQPQEELHGAMKIAQMAGSAAGSIADFMLLSKVVGKGVGSLAEATAAKSTVAAYFAENAAAQGLLTAGATGFINGSVLTPVAAGESQWRRLGQGTVDAGSFLTLSAIGNKLAPRFGPGFAGRVGVEAISGAGAGVVNTNLDAWTHGHLASVQDNLSGASSWAIGNVVMGETVHGVGQGVNAVQRYAGFDDPVRAIAPVGDPTPNPSPTPEPDRPPKIWTILSIDGGGIRGTLPAEVLARLEAETGLHTTDMFDIIAGTSTGGILANGLTKPGLDGKPQYTAADMVKLYEEEGPGIFSTNWARIAKSWIFGGAKYSGVGLDNTMQKYFGDNTLFKDQIGKVMVPAVETTTRQPWFFKNWEPEDGQMLTRDISRATSAAPTYFPPVKFNTPGLQDGALIDGGMNANDPAAAALAEAVRLSKPGDEFVVVSLGTGKYTKPYSYESMVKNRPFQWLQPTLDILQDGMPSMANYELSQVMKLCPTEMQAKLQNAIGFYRFNTNLTPATEVMDDASPSNIQALKALGDRIVDSEQTDQFTQLAHQLKAIRQSKLVKPPAPASN